MSASGLQCLLNPIQPALISSQELPSADMIASKHLKELTSSGCSPFTWFLTWQLLTTTMHASLHAHTMPCFLVLLRVPGVLSQFPSQTIKQLLRTLSYYSSPVHKNLSSKYDRFLPARSQFDTNHSVDFYAPTCCLSATFVHPFFCVCPLFFTTTNHK